MPSRGNERVVQRRSADRCGSPAAAARIDLLGGFRLVLASEPVQPPLHAQKLLAFLAVDGAEGRPLHRAYVAGQLWLDRSQDQANGCLRSALWRLSRLDGDLVHATATHVGLDPAVVTDAPALERCARRVLRASAPPAVADVDRLAGAGELVPDWYDDWALRERDRLRQIRLLALEAAGEALIASGRFADGAIAALAALDADPLRESACRLLIRAYLGAGNVGEARHQFLAFQTRLRERLGLAPSPQMAELMRLAPAGR